MVSGRSRSRLLRTDFPALPTFPFPTSPSMPWQIAVLILIVLVVVVGATIFANSADAPKRNKSTDLRPEAGTVRPRPEKKPVSDLDRFLAEARRRRESAEKRTQPPAPVPLPVAPPRPANRSPEPPRPAPRPRPQPPVERPRQAKSTRPQPPLPSPRRPASAPEPVTVQPIPVFQVIAEPEATVRPTAPTPPQQTPVNEVTPATAALASNTTNERSMSPAFAQIVTLLGSPRKAAAAAFILGEIFNKPLSLRNRRD